MARAPVPAEVVVEEPPVADDMAAADLAAEGDAPVVVATILKNADGSYVLETGAGAAEMIEGAEAMAPAGKSFAPDEAGIGELMTAVLDLVDPENAGSPQAAANFAEGFNGEAPKAAAA